MARGKMSIPSQNVQANAPSSLAQLSDGIRQTTGSLQQNHRCMLQTIPRITHEIDQEWHRVTRHINCLEAELDECRTQIFKSLPTDGISDTCIREEYSFLRENLSNWVEGFPEIDSFASVMKKYKVRPRGSPAWFPEGHSAAQLEIMISIIFNSLWLRVFTVLVFSASPSDLGLLGGLYHGMHLMKPEKDFDTISLWRADTLRAYTSHQSFEEQLHTSCSQLTNDICASLNEFSFAENVDMVRKFNRFMEQIAKPAAGLAIKMSCSPEQYYWDWYIGSEWYAKAVVRKSDMSNFIIVDALTHQNIRIAKFKDLPDGAKIGDLLLVMYPALFRCGKKSERNIQIEKAVILIRVNSNSAPPEKDEMGIDQEKDRIKKTEAKKPGLVTTWAKYLFGQGKGR